MEIFNGEINGVNPAFVKQNESLYNTTESAIQELVDNSIDAESSEINIEVLDNRFVIRDNSSTGISFEILNEIANEMILNSTKECDFSNIKILDKDIEQINIAEIIRNYQIKETSGRGFIVIAALLDKSVNRATYKIVLFDVETREILKEEEFTSKAGGFGLRNFWANTIYTLTKKFRFDKNKQLFLYI